MSIKKKIGGALMGTALGAALIGGGTFAIFTDSDTNTGNSFAAGTLDINLDKADGVKYFDISTMAPGDFGSAPVVVSNDGTLELRYDFSTTLSGDLAAGADGLKVTVYTDAALQVPATVENRVLAAGASETLYVKYELPQAAGNEYQGDTATLAISADAEQTRNN